MYKCVGRSVICCFPANRNHFSDSRLDRLRRLSFLFWRALECSADCSSSLDSCGVSFSFPFSSIMCTQGTEVLFIGVNHRAYLCLSSLPCFKFDSKNPNFPEEMKANNPFAGDPRSWSIAKVERWVEHACNTGGYGDLFTTNHIDGKVLGSLTMAQVLEMAPAMTMGHRVKLEKALFEVKQRIMCFNQSSEPPESASLEEKRQCCLEIWGKTPRFNCIFKDTQIFQLLQAPSDRSFDSDQEYIEFLVAFTFVNT